MDMDDPIQQILKNTGWSCDDLLQKLQIYKSQKENEKNQLQSVITEKQTLNSEKSNCKIINEENNECKNQTLGHEKTNKTSDIYQSESKNSITDCHRVQEEFSDTDEEEIEEHVTHSNIIDEIIDDISCVDNIEELGDTRAPTNKPQEENNEEEVTEVRVIEVNEEYEDDYFEEEGSYSMAKQSESETFCSNNFEYLETFPRKFSMQPTPIDLAEGDDNIDNDDFISECNNIGKECNTEKEIFHNKESNKFFPEENSLKITSTNIETFDTCSKKITEIPDDDKEESCLSIENINENGSKLEEIKEKCFDNNINITNTTMIYQKSCEKVLNLTTETNDRNNVSEPLDKITNKKLYSPASEKHNNQDDEDGDKEESIATDLEDIRNNLKLQLNSLRTRKKGQFLQQLRTNDVNSLECNKKIVNHNSLEDTNTSFQTEKRSRSVEATDISKKPSATHTDNQENDLYTQTNEFGLVILSVEGGINLDEQDNEKDIESIKQSPDMTNDDSSNMSSAIDNSVDHSSFLVQQNVKNSEKRNDTTGVFDQIRKIIQKQKQNNCIHNKKNSIEVTSQPKDVINNFGFFSKTTTASNEKPVVTTSADNSQSSFTNDDTSQTADKNSPFVSNTLDEFLTENSKLNISYKVPKCGAEDGLTDSYRDESPLLLKKMIELDKEQVQVSKKTKTIKAKTVAQKRKILEKQRLKEMRKIIKMKKQSDDGSVINNKDTLKQTKQSYIEINDKKLWVRAVKPNICVAKINSSVKVRSPLNQCHRRKKLSLLTELGKTYNEKIKYLPGPLSKKPTLQITGHDKWETETKLLPKIQLEVIPKFGQRLPPNIISMLPQCNAIVTADQAEFALSMLRTNGNSTENKTFKFPVSYQNNQEKIVVKKRRASALKYITEENGNNQNCINSVVAHVIDDLIRYVEIKEIAPSLIKEEEYRYSCEDSNLDKMPVIAENISSIFKKPQKKKSKVELELLRLSCKVVNVEVEENSIEESCDKPFCRLGCVCKSLKCDGMITYHCQNVGCMLECKCPRERSIEYDKLMLPAGTDILSRDTVTRIEDEAKKDLAKIEREFTQTVIHTNDKTIVVGTGGRHKTRRPTKAPIKYSDYIHCKFEDFKDEKVQMQKKNDFSKKCFVSLEKINLQDVIPYCLFHNLYNCHCESKSSSSYSQTTKNICKSAVEKKPENTTSANKKCLRNIKVTPPKQSKMPKDSVNISTTNVDCSLETKLVSTSGRPIRINRKLKEDFNYYDEVEFKSTSCARTLGVPSHVLINRGRSIKALQKLIKDDFSNNISQADLLKAKLSTSSPELLEVDILKRCLALESNNTSMSFVENALNESKHKRKQVLEVRSDDVNSKPLINQDLAIQRRKKTGVVTRPSTVVEPIFDGEIIVDERNMELLQKMGYRTVMDGYARLLPWTALINGFSKGDIKIWCMVDLPSRLLINKSDKNPPKNYIDIKKTIQTTEVILWILSKKLPSRYQEDHVSFILKQTKDNYEICGLCTKNLNRNSATGINSETEILTKVSNDKDALLFKHKDLNGIQQLMCLSKTRFKLQELVEENLAAIGETSVEKNKLYMWAALPEIFRVCKWRMIFLNSDFSFLYFTKMKYSIKYTDLLCVSNKAKEANCTVVLRNSIICVPYDHSAFGIYFDPHYQDRLFIGPYFKQHSDNDVETLRYINQALVCTESFNKMQGKSDYKCGHWLVERPYGRATEQPTIDLTNDTLYKKGLKRKKNMDIPQSVKKSKSATEENEKIIITENNDHIRVIDSEPRTPEEFNRYIITNIPHLGYLGALQHEDSSEIDVSWPFENKMLRFQTVNSATTFLQSRFSSLLQSVPETFKINIIVMTHIDLEKSKPIDANILSGHYVCGEFGCYNVKTVTSQFCVDKIGITREELLRIFARRAQMFVRQKIEELADIINIPKTERYDIVNILNKAQKDIKSLREIKRRHMVEKNNLLLSKRALALKAFCLISVLPANEKHLEGWKFRQILKKQSLLLPQTTSKPIEITDSDEEDENASSQNKSSSNQDLELADTLSSTPVFESSFTDQNSEIVETAPLSVPDRIKVPSNNQSETLKPSLFDKNVPTKVML